MQNPVFRASVKGKKMKRFDELSLCERRELYGELCALYEGYKAMGLSLDLSRGKPNGAQLDISNGLLTVDLTDS